MFTRINQEQWERKEHYEYYTKVLPCSYSVTVQLDVTMLKKRVEQYGDRFYPVFVYCVSRAINGRKEFRMGTDGDGNPGYWDVVHPNFTIFHKDDHTFSDVWTYYTDSFLEFYDGMTKVMETYKDVKGIKARDGQPPNFYCISCVPWMSFTGYQTYVAGDRVALFPIITYGKYEERDGKWQMPMTLTISHAAADGYHSSQLFLEIQQIIDQDYRCLK